jgi:hypothetical protein
MADSTVVRSMATNSQLVLAFLDHMVIVRNASNWNNPSFHLVTDGETVYVQGDGAKLLSALLGPLFTDWVDSHK